MMKTTGLLVVFTLFVILYQTSAVPVASSYALENENVMDVMVAKKNTEEYSDDEKNKEEDEDTDKEEEKSDEDKKDDDVKNEDDEDKEDEDKKDEEESKEEEKDDKQEDKEEEPDLNEPEDDQESSGEESVDLDSDHLVLQGSGNGKIKGVVIDDSDKEKEDKPEKRSVDDNKTPAKGTQAKRCGCGDAFDSGGCDYMGGGCGGAPGGVYGPQCGCGGCGSAGTNDWCAAGTMCSNCKGGFGAPISCAGCNNGCCPSLTFPCAFGATVNNPGCECCKEKTPPGKCKWPCMWPCCCTCTPPKFEFKPLKPEPVCHCPSGHSHHTACGHHCLRSSTKRGPVKRSLMEEQPAAYMPHPYNYGYAPFYNPFYNGMPMMPYPRLF